MTIERDIETMSWPELRALGERVRARYVALRNAAIADINETMVAYGITRDMLHEATKKRRKSRKQREAEA